MVPGVNVMELAWITRPTVVFCFGLNLTIVGLMGSVGLMIILLTVQADFTISRINHGQ